MCVETTVRPATCVEPITKRGQAWAWCVTVRAMTNQLLQEDAAAGYPSRGLARVRLADSRSIAELHRMIQLLIGGSVRFGANETSFEVRLCMPGSAWNARSLNLSLYYSFRRLGPSSDRTSFNLR
jgi:hypothetical protein